MAKTELTRNIEDSIRYYRPSETCGIRVNKFRGTSTAFEVPTVCGTTKFGLVDCVRVQEYFGDIKHRHVCSWYGEGAGEAFKLHHMCKKGHDKPPDGCEENCPYRRLAETGTPKILITCYEIKVTKSDFKSKNGHNFVGNCNYYVIPKELYDDVKDLVPEDIGIILYLHAGSYVGLRRKKECTFKELTDEDQKWLVLSVMKRLEDTTWKERARGGPTGDLGLW